MAKTLQYHLFRDIEATGNFDVSLHPNSDLNDGIILHSKKQSGDFPLDNWDTFETKLKEALASFNT